MGIECQLQQIGELSQIEEINLKSKLEKTGQMAKAYALATKALEKVDEAIKSEHESLQLKFPLTKIIKISNLIDEEQAQFYQQ